MNNEDVMRQLRKELAAANELLKRAIDNNNKIRLNEKALKIKGQNFNVDFNPNDFDALLHGYNNQGITQRITAFYDDFNSSGNTPSEMSNDQKRNKSNEIRRKYRKLLRKKINLMNIIEEIENGDINWKNNKDKNDCLSDIQNIIDGMKDIGLSDEEIEARLKAIKGAASRSETIKLLYKELDMMQYDIYALKTYHIYFRNPEMEKTINDVFEIEADVQKENNYRQNSKELSEKFNELSKIYQALEDCNSIISNPHSNPREVARAKRERDKIINDVDKKYNEGKGLNPKNAAALALALVRENLEDNAFERNKNNGVVDPDVLKRDKYVVGKPDIMEKIQKTIQDGKTMNLEVSRELYDFQELVMAKKLADDIKTRLEKTPPEDVKALKQKLDSIVRKHKEELHGKSEWKGFDNLDDAKVKDLAEEISKKAEKEVSRALNDAKTKKKKTLEKYVGKGKARYVGDPQKAIDNAVEEIRGLSRVQYVESFGNKKVESKTPTQLNEILTEQKEIYDKMDNGRKTVAVKNMRVDVEEQINEHGVQKIKDGKVYRCERFKNVIHYIEEDLELYTKNPKEKLNDVLDNLSDKIKEGFKGDYENNNPAEEFKEFMQGDSQKLLKSLTSSNPITRFNARRKFIADLEKGGLENVVSMAIALQSEVTPEKIVEVLDRKSQPYSRESDLAATTHIVKKKGFLGIGSSEKLEIKANDTMNVRARRKERMNGKSEIETFASDQDIGIGVVRPFSISREEMGEDKVNLSTGKPGPAPTPTPTPTPGSRPAHGSNKKR